MFYLIKIIFHVKLNYDSLLLPVVAQVNGFLNLNHNVYDVSPFDEPSLVGRDDFPEKRFDSVCP